MCHEENGDLKGIFCLCIYFPSSSAGEGKVSQCPALGTTFLSPVFRAETDRVQVPQLHNLLESKKLNADTKLQCLLYLGYIIMKYLVPEQLMYAWHLLTPF